MLAKFSGVESERNISKLRERKRKFSRCVHLLHKTGLKLGIVQRRLRKAQKSVMHVQSFCFANINLLLFCRSCCCRRCCWLSSILLLSRKIATMSHFFSPCNPCRSSSNLSILFIPFLRFWAVIFMAVLEFR